MLHSGWSGERLMGVAIPELGVMRCLHELPWLPLLSAANCATMSPMDLLAIARAFATDGVPEVVEPLGNGNVNATYLVRTSSGTRYVLQRLNTAVFAKPELVMANLKTLASHAAGAISDGSPWQLPRPVPLQGRDGNGSLSGMLLRTNDQGACHDYVIVIACIGHTSAAASTSLRRASSTSFTNFNLPSSSNSKTSGAS